MENMNSNTKLEVAIEILATKIAMLLKNGCTIENKKMKQLVYERDEIYKGNEIIMNKIILNYGPEVKKNFEEIKKEII